MGDDEKERVGPRGQHPIRPLLDRVLRAFGGIEIDLYPVKAGLPVQVVFAEPFG